MRSRWNLYPKESRQSRGYGAEWQKIRKVALERDHYLCVPCRKQGLVTEAKQVDHILPKEKGGTDDLENLQSICIPCHEEKTLRDVGHRPRPTIGLDGWPEEKPRGGGGRGKTS